MNKKIILPLLLMFAGLTATSCSGNSSLNDSGIFSKNENNADFEITLEVLTDATYSFTFNTSGDVKWSSDNETVATVDNGFIIAKSAGEALVTCECGIEKKTIDVTVINHGYVPNVDFGLINNVVNLNVNATYKLIPTLTYVGKTYDDAIYSYSTGDQSIATVDENGSIKGKSEGETTVTVVTEWRGFDSKLLTYKIPVIIK